MRLHGHEVSKESREIATRRYAVVHGCWSGVHRQAVLVAHKAVHGSHGVRIVKAADDNALRANLYGNRVEVAGHGNVLEAIRSEKESVEVSIAGDVVTDNVAVRIDAEGGCYSCAWEIKRRQGSRGTSCARKRHSSE